MSDHVCSLAGCDNEAAPIPCSGCDTYVCFDHSNRNTFSVLPPLCPDCWGAAKEITQQLDELAATLYERSLELVRAVRMGRMLTDTRSRERDKLLRYAELYGGKGNLP